MIHHISVAQAHPLYGDVPANLALMSDLAREAVAQGSELVVFPELSTTGYSFDSVDELNHVLDGGTGLDQMATLSAELGIVIALGYAEINRGIAYNKAALLDNGVLLADYVKTHLWNTEKILFEPGQILPPIVDTSVGRIALAICYDLEFPDLIRHCAVNGADIIAAPTNWPSGFEAPTHHGPFNGELLRAMAGASTNRVYIAIACRTGAELDIDWVDNSCIIGPDGYPITKPIHGVGIATAAVDLHASRTKSISPRNDVFTDRRSDLY